MLKLLQALKIDAYIYIHIYIYIYISMYIKHAYECRLRCSLSRVDLHPSDLSKHFMELRCPVACCQLKTVCSIQSAKSTCAGVDHVLSCERAKALSKLCGVYAGFLRKKKETKTEKNCLRHKSETPKHVSGES